MSTIDLYAIWCESFHNFMIYLFHLFQNFSSNSGVTSKHLKMAHHVTASPKKHRQYQEQCMNTVGYAEDIVCC